MQPQIKSILVAAGLGNDTAHLLDYALSLAQKYAARIHIVHGYENIDISTQNMAELYMFQNEREDSVEKSLQERERRIRAQIEELWAARVAGHAAEKGLLAGIEVSRKPPKQAILDAAAEHAADLILMGSHRHSVLTDALLGSTTMKVLHSASIPVFVIRLPA